MCTFAIARSGAPASPTRPLPGATPTTAASTPAPISRGDTTNALNTATGTTPIPPPSLPPGILSKETSRTGSMLRSRKVRLQRPLTPLTLATASWP